MFLDSSIPIPNTSTVSQLTPQFVRYFEGSINVLNLIPGKEYGPYYRIDSRNWNMTIKDIYCKEERGRWFGDIKPRSKKEARKLYHLPNSNKCEYVYTIYLYIPNNAYECVLFWGEVKNGHANQYHLNNHGVLFAKPRKFQQEKLCERENESDGYLKISTEVPIDKL